MYRKLNVVLNDTCPKKVRKIRLKANVWYTGKHKELAKKIKAAYKRGKRNLGEAWTFYKKLIKRYKKLCKRSRNASWKKYKENRQTVNEMVKLMNIIQKKKKNKINTFVKANGKTTDPGEETLNALITAHFPNAVDKIRKQYTCLLYTSPSPRDKRQSRMPSSA